jgi:hypothetical protein
MMTTIHLVLGPIGVSVSAGIRSTFDRVRIEFDRILAFDRYRIYGGHIRFDANLLEARSIRVESTGQEFLGVRFDANLREAHSIRYESAGDAFDSIRINGGHIRFERQGLAFDSIDS